MSLPRHGHHVHRVTAGLVVDGAASALDAVDMTQRHSPAADVVVLLLGPDRRVESAVAVVGTHGEPDAVLAVVETFAARGGEYGPWELVVATPRSTLRPLPDDTFRWIALSDLAEESGALLLEWFVVSGAAAFCPRDLIAEPPRW